MTSHDALLAMAEDDAGYPNMAFEHFYQYGMECFYWRLPKPLVRVAFKRACQTWKAESDIAMWQIRAFIYGLNGHQATGEPVAQPFAPETYRWPLPPDPSWTLVACVYSDGIVELDIVHETSRRFWSEDNGFLDLPPDDGRRLSRRWFERVGIDVILMKPAMTVDLAVPKRHLRPV